MDDKIVNILYNSALTALGVVGIGYVSRKTQRIYGNSGDVTGNDQTWCSCWIIKKPRNIFLQKFQ